MIIQGFSVADNTVFEIGKFAILWNLFERNWCNKKCNPDVIRTNCAFIKIDCNKQDRLARALNEQREWFGTLEMDYVIEALHDHDENGRRSKEEDMQLMRDFLAREGTKQSQGCLLVIYRLRNNLMHGIKELDKLDGQIEIFRAANDILEHLE